MRLPCREACRRSVSTAPLPASEFLSLSSLLYKLRRLTKFRFSNVSLPLRALQPFPVMLHLLAIKAATSSLLPPPALGEAHLKNSSIVFNFPWLPVAKRSGGALAQPLCQPRSFFPLSTSTAKKLAFILTTPSSYSPGLRPPPLSYEGEFLFRALTTAPPNYLTKKEPALV